MNHKINFAFVGMAALAGVTTVVAQESVPLFKIGSVEVRPHASYKLNYDDNIFLDHKGAAAGAVGNNAGRDHDFIHFFTPGLRLNAGDVNKRQSGYFNANYEALFTKFTDYTGSDATDHNALIGFGGKFNRLTLGVQQTYVSTSTAEVATLAANGRVKAKTWNTAVNANYELSDKTTLGLDLGQIIGDYAAPLVDSVERTAALWMDHQVLPKVKAGLGATLGYLQVDGTAANHNPNSSYIQGLARFDWAATEKTNIKGSAGVESRNIQERGSSDPVTMVFTLGADWQATESTTVNLNLTRGNRVVNAVVAQFNRETSITASVRHSLGERVSLALEGGYSLSQYQAASLAAVGLRDDNYFFVKPAISYRFAERAQASVYYQYRRNDANLVANGNDFYGNQLGLELSYRF